MSIKIIGKECKHVTHFYGKDNRPDLHVIKEILHYNNGDKKPNLRIIKNYERPFWITKPINRKHKQKKEYEYKDKLQMHKSTVTNLRRKVSRLLNISENYINNSPYLYGTDTPSSAIIKYMYKIKHKNTPTTPYKVAVFDFETDIDTKEAKILSVTTNDEIHVGVVKDIVKNISNPIESIRKYFNKYIPEDKYKKLPLYIYIVDDDVELIRIIFDKIHKIQPDWLTAWNITFDLSVIIDICNKYNIKIENILSDPNIPNNYRVFNYRQAPKYKQKENGDRVPVEIQEQWHTIESTSSFQMIDAMCTYAIIRLGTPKVQGGYSLDNILEKEGITKKLKFDHLQKESKEKEDWHRDMLKNHPIEYIIYNIWDCLSILALDDKTKDMQFTLPTMLDNSMVKDFKSQPKRLRDQMFFYLLERDKIMGVCPKEADKLNNYLLGTDNWIITLPSDLIVNNGLCVLKDYPNIHTNIRAHVYDNDAVSSYPSNIRVANVSKTTTKRELSKIANIKKDVFTKQNINLTVGKCNAIEYCITMFNFPTLDELLEEIIE